MKGKRVREKGKIRLSQYFKPVADGSLVSIVPEASVRAGFPSRMKGKSGKVTGSRGKYKIVEVKDGGKTKTFIIHPIHLKILGKGGKAGVTRDIPSKVGTSVPSSSGKKKVVTMKKSKGERK